VATPLAVVVVWAALVVPNRLDDLHPAAFVRIPVEILLPIGIGLALPRSARRVVAGVLGFALGLLVILKLLDMGFYDELDRPFNPVVDRASFGPAIGVLRDSVGAGWAQAIVVGVLLLFALIVVALTLASVRLAESSARNRQLTLRASGTLGMGWLLSSLLSVQVVPGVPVASGSAADLAANEVQAVRASIHDQQVFAATLKSRDPQAHLPEPDLLSRLRGKDVVLAFVESYGQVAVHGTPFSRGVDAVLRDGTDALGRAGYQSQSGYLTSPTFGGISWLAHSTLQTGLWIDSQQRYDQVIPSGRFTLSQAFRRAGWQTVSDIPSDPSGWPQGKAFYHFDRMYDASNVGYQGPRFAYARIPDEYTLRAFQRLELAPGHAPVMAEIDLDSSHLPWSPLPRFLPWNALGDGSRYADQPPRGRPPSEVWQSAAQVQRMYGLSVQYALKSLVTFVTHAHDKNLVLILLGDHQPVTTVSGTNASHDVPISIVARDPAVLDAISGWHWDRGLLPTPDAPTWPMSEFRDRFLAAFSDPVRGTSSVAMPSH
jgi:hypothetical protein